MKVMTGETSSHQNAISLSGISASESERLKKTSRKKKPGTIKGIQELRKEAGGGKG